MVDDIFVSSDAALLWAMIWFQSVSCVILCRPNGDEIDGSGNVMTVDDQPKIRVENKVMIIFLV